MSRRSRRRRSKARIVVPILLLLLVLSGLWSNFSLQVEEVAVPVADLPAEFEGLRIAQISDLHGAEFGADNEKLLSAVRAARPDLIAITGDLIDQSSQLSMIPPLAAGLAAIAPTYYVTGNHEWAIREVRAVKGLLEQAGVTVLSNDWVPLERNGAVLALAGAEDPQGPADQLTGAQLRGKIPHDCTVLLSHRDSVDEYTDWGYDLILAGHGHGGVFRIPIADRGLLSTDRTLFPDYDGGLYELAGGDHCFVSRGLGNNTTPIHAFRLFNPPHLPILILTQGAAE